MGQLDHHGGVVDGGVLGPGAELRSQQDEQRPKPLAPGLRQMRRGRIDLQIVEADLGGQHPLDHAHLRVQPLGQRSLPETHAQSINALASPRKFINGPGTIPRRSVPTAHTPIATAE